MKIIVLMIAVVLTAALVNAQEVIFPNPNWVGLYGGNPRLDGNGLQVGDTIKAYDAQNILCGITTVRLAKTAEFWTVYGFMPIYGDDPWTEGDQGWGRDDTLVPGQPVLDDSCNYIVYLTVDGVRVKETVKVKSVGELIRIDEFHSCCQKRGDLTGDNVVDLSDLTAFIGAMTIHNACMRSYLYKCPAAADITNDGIVDITDLASFISYFYIKDWKIPPCNVGR